MKKIILSIFLGLIIIGNAFAAKPTDYLIIYQNTFNLQGKSNQSLTKIFCQESTKFRVESETLFNKETNGEKTSGKSLSVSILRLDKQVQWLFDSENKTYREIPISQKTLENNPSFWFQSWKSKLTKISEEKILGYNCDVYVSSSKYPSKYWFNSGYNLLLKTESGIDANKTTCEAIELHFEKQDDSLFEIPRDYQIMKQKISSIQELDKQPPVTLTDIEKLLFADMESVKLRLSKNDKFRDLTSDEIIILRNSFISGRELGEASKQETEPISNDYQNPVFLLEWSGKQQCDFWYDKASGYIYVEKCQVFRKEWKNHEFDFKWLKKYINGGYRFKPSPEIEEIIK